MHSTIEKNTRKTFVFGEEDFKGKGEGRVSILEILQGSLSKSVECSRGGAEDVTGSQMLSQQDTARKI